jgi:hypothetical protein
MLCEVYGESVPTRTTLAFLGDPRFATARLGDVELAGIAADVTTYRDAPAIHLVEAGPSAYGERLAILPASDLGDGTIEATLSGDTLPDAPPGARGFVGIAFHVGSPGEPFEAFWLRPTNGRADDQLRRNHAAQYAAYPDHWWDRLREQSPGVYESYVDLVPGALTDIRIAITGARARLYVHGSDQPTLVVNDLKLGARRGRTAIWIGGGTDAHLTRLWISASGGGAATGAMS